MVISNNSLVYTCKAHHHTHTQWKSNCLSYQLRMPVLCCSTIHSFFSVRLKRLLHIFRSWFVFTCSPSNFSDSFVCWFSFQCTHTRTHIFMLISAVFKHFFLCLIFKPLPTFELIAVAKCASHVIQTAVNIHDYTHMKLLCTLFM